MRPGPEPKASSLGRVIASRTLRTQGIPKSKIVVSIGLPKRHPRLDWECPFLIDGVGESKVESGYGVDSMQALFSALQGIRADIEGRELFWLDRKRGTFLPILAPTGLGKEFEQRVQRAIEREIVRAWRATIKSRRGEISLWREKLRRQGKAPRDIAQRVANAKAHLDEWESWIRKLKPGWNQLSHELRRK